MLPRLVFQAASFMYYITCPPHLPLYYACMRWMDWTLTKIAKTWENYTSGRVAPWWHRLYLVHTFIIHYTFYTVRISYKGYITFLYFVWWSHHDYHIALLELSTPTRTHLCGPGDRDCLWTDGIAANPTWIRQTVTRTTTVRLQIEDPTLLSV